MLDHIAKGDFAEAKTDKELYEKFVDILKNEGHLNGETLSTFKLALSMRSAVPRIEAHYQYYATGVEPSLSDSQEGCESWILRKSPTPIHRKRPSRSVARPFL